MIRQTTTKVMSVGVVLMGMIHVLATFSPMIADKLALLPGATQEAFRYFSLMCGTHLILGGSIINLLAEKVAEHDFVRKPYCLTLGILVVAGVLAVCYMRHNPFAWMIFALTMLLLLVNVGRRGE